MGAPAKLNFKVYQGSTFSEVLRWESGRKVYKPITGLTQAAPAVITSAAHGVPDNWRVKVTNVGGMTEINSTESYLIATLRDLNTIELNSINSLGYKAYTTGGVVEYNEPVNLTGYTARMQIRSKLDADTFIDELTTENSGISISTSNYTITLTIPAADTALYTFTNPAVYSLEMISSGGVVVPFSNGTITLVKEVTR